MAPRKRKIENKHFPTGLFRRNLRGVNRFKYRFPNGKEVLLPAGTQEFEAIEAATIFNQKHRNPIITLLTNYDEYNKPLKEWTKIVVECVRQEELKQKKLTDDGFRRFKLDIARLDSLLGGVLSKSINLAHVNDFLREYAGGKSNEIHNKKRSFLVKVFSYIVDQSGMEINYAENKKRKSRDDKQRQRLDAENYNLILKASTGWLNIAMRLSLQTTHSVNEISLAKYKDCEWFKAPVVENDLTVYGILRIHRQKVKKKEASRVEIPITKKIKDIIDDSRKDHVLSPYIVHATRKRSGKTAESLTHPTQQKPIYLSTAFSNLRDSLHLYDHLTIKQRPSFHEIRALSIFQYDKVGFDPQERAAHSDSKTTKIYMKGHVKWVRTQAAELII